MFNRSFGSFSIPLSVTYNATDSSTSNSTSYSFPTISTGVAASTRKLYVGVTTGSATDANTSVSAVTVGGNAATEVVGVTGNFAYVGFWGIDLPTGTSETIAVTASAGTLRCTVWSYSAYDAIGVNATDSGSSNVTSTWTRSIDVVNNGAVISSSSFVPGSGSTTTWTGLDEMTDQVLESARIVSSAFRDGLSADATYDYTIDTDDGGGAELSAFATISLE